MTDNYFRDALLYELDSRLITAEISTGCLPRYSLPFVERSDESGGRLKPTSEDGRTAMTTVYAVTAGSGDTYRIERIYLDGDEAYGFAQAYNGIAPVEPVQVEEWQDGCPAGRLRRPVLARGVVGAHPGQQASRDAAQHRRGRTLRRLRDSTGMVDRRGAARGQGGAPRTDRCAEDRGRRPVQGEGGRALLGRGYPGQGRPGGHPEEVISASLVQQMERNGHGASTMPPRCVMIAAWTAARWNGSATTS